MSENNLVIHIELMIINTHLIESPVFNIINKKRLPNNC